MTLPSDLERLGRQLELAAQGAVRRRARRQRVLAALAALAVAVPIAVTLAGGGAGPPAAGPPAVADPDATYADYGPAPGDNVAVRQLQRARPAPDPPDPACLDSSQCGRARPPMRLLSYPDPARRA